ncbi:MAG: transglutaminaseTgpA domain-containing protein, partial [Chloroflexota bacterium]|nr:transglutaminaseTgpA domain-containing protein [Chloroflexota bacterium]
MPRLKAVARSLFPPIDGGRLRFRGGLVALPLFLVINLLYPVSLQQADWVATSGHFTYVAALAVLFGTLAGNGRMDPRRAGLLGVGLGALVVLLLTSYADSSGTLRERAVIVAVHVNNWLTQAIAGEAASDPTAFVLFLGASVWAASFVGSFALAREHRVWDAVLLCGLCLLVNVSLALTSLLVDLIVFTLCTLVLLTRLHIVDLQERWTRQNIQPSGEMDWRVLRGGLTWTAVLVIMALVTPRVGAAEAMSTALTTVERPYQALEAEWQRFFAGVSGPSRLRGVSFTDAIRLGLAPNLGDRTVFTVDVPDGQSGRFWRAVTYDFYTGAGWKTTETDKAD